MADPMTARQFLESSWFKLLWRGVIVVGIPALSGVSAYAGYTLNSVYGQQASLTQEVAEIKETQSDRATVNDEFQSEITSDVAAIGLKVEKISAPDDKTVVFDLDKPSALFLAALARTDCAMTGILHKDSLKADGSFDKPIGTGPFMLGDWRRGEFVSL